MIARVLILSSSEENFLSVVSFLCAVSDRIKHVDTVYGSGWCAVVALLLCLGYSPLEIMDQLHIMKKENIVNGLLRKKIQRLIENKTVHVPTMSKLYYMTGRSLVLAVRDEMMHSRNSYASMSCLDALFLTLTSEVYDVIPISYFNDERCNILSLETRCEKVSYYSYCQRRCERTGRNVMRVCLSTQHHQAFNQGLDFCDNLIPQSLHEREETKGYEYPAYIKDPGVQNESSVSGDLL